MGRIIIAIVAIAAIIALVVALNSAFPNVLADDQSRIQIFATIGWLTLLIGGMALRFRSQPGTALRALAAWALVALVLIWIYAYRFEAGEIGNRMLGVLLPSHGIVTEPSQQVAGVTSENGGGSGSEIRFALNQYGHYQVSARVNGTYVTFLVDTGASDVVLSLADARRIGMSESQLNFNERVETANGIAYAASVVLNNLTIGPIVINRMPAKINHSPMQYSLLGMRFLNQLHSWRVEGQTLILQQ
jgi:aspartyl protease family protein